jgi:hypothetical protein
MNLGTCLTGVAVARAQLEKGASVAAARSAVMDALKTSRPWGLRGYGQEAERWARDAGGWTGAALDSALSELLLADKRLKNTTIDDEVKILRGALLAMAQQGVKAA